jgi:hypothetical protein
MGVEGDLGWGTLRPGSQSGETPNKSGPANLDAKQGEYGNDVGNSPSDRGFAQKACIRPLGETKVVKKPQWN